MESLSPQTCQLAGYDRGQGMPPVTDDSTSFPLYISIDHAILGIRLRLIDLETTVRPQNSLASS